MGINVVKFKRLDSPRNTLVGFAEIECLPSSICIRDVAVHQKADQRWVSMPARSYVAAGETKWVPYVRFGDLEK